MGCLLISSTHVKNLIDKVILDLKNGMGYRMYDLAGVLAAIAEAQDDPILHVIPQAVGGFGNTLISARSMVALPMLPDQIRQRINTMINTAVKEATSSLKTIKSELCSKDDTDHKTLMHAIGILFQQANILLKESASISSRRQSQPTVGIER